MTTMGRIDHDAQERDHLIRQVPLGTIGGDIVDGDKITVGNVDGDGAVAVGNGAKASVFNIDIRLLPVVLGLGVIAVLLAYFQFFSGPTTMDPGFNIAVAEFRVLDENGKPIRSEEGKNFSQWLYKRVDDGLRDGLAEEIPEVINVWGPQNTGVIEGDSEEERNQFLEERAAEIGADVIIYGDLEEGPNQSETAIEFYIAHDSFEEGEDIKGHHDYGGWVPLANPFEGGLDALTNQRLMIRAKSLNLLAIGLAYYSIDDFDNAIRYLQSAASDEDWQGFEEEGQQVLKMLLGNAFGRKAAIELNPTLLPQAKAYYQEALAIDAEYERALVGQASIDFALALGDPNNPEDQIDPALLDTAEAGFEKALALVAKNDPSNIKSKVNFGLGNVYAIRYQIEGGDWLDKAMEQYSAVTSAFEEGRGSNKNIASHAYGRRGFINDVYFDDPEKAAGLYEQAAELATPYYGSMYLSLLGDMYVEMCQLEQAAEVYEEAIRLAKFAGRREQANEYQAKQDSAACS